MRERQTNANASGNSSDNIATGTSANASGLNSNNVATGNSANASGGGSNNIATGTLANASGGKQLQQSRPAAAPTPAAPYRATPLPA